MRFHKKVNESLRKLSETSFPVAVNFMSITVAARQRDRDDGIDTFEREIAQAKQITLFKKY